jgi:hypothetical protein
MQNVADLVKYAFMLHKIAERMTLSLQVHCDIGPFPTFSIPLGRNRVLHLRFARGHHLHGLPQAREGSCPSFSSTQILQTVLWASRLVSLGFEITKCSLVYRPLLPMRYN